MVVHTLQQRWEILRLYFENHGNVAEYLRKLWTDFGRREALSASYVRSLSYEKSEKKLASSSLNQSVKSQKQCVHPRILLLWQKACVWSAININSPSFSTIEHFGDIIETNFAQRPWYDAIQSSIGSGAEANWPSNAFSLR